MKDMKYYMDKFPGLHIIQGSLFDKKEQGFSYSTDGPNGGWMYLKDLSFFESDGIQEKMDQDLKLYRRHLELAKIYPFLYISRGHVWIRSVDYPDRDGIGVTLEKPLDMYNLPSVFLEELNEEAKMYHSDPKNYFFCSTCNKTYLKKSVTLDRGITFDELLDIKPNRFGDTLWSGCYCTLCIASNSELRAEIARSKKPGYYD